MVNHYRHILFFLLIIILNSSCEKSLQIDQFEETKLVVNAILEVDKKIQINLTRTRNILDPKDSIDWVRNADVYLRIDGNSYSEKLVYDSIGNYTSELTAEYSRIYELEIEHPEYPDVYAQAHMPSKPLGFVKFLQNSGITQSGSTFELEITNNRNSQYYIWEMFTDKTGSTFNISSQDKKTDNILPDETLTRDKIFFDATQFESDILNSHFTAYDFDEQDLSVTKVRLITVNSDMYQYYRSLELYNNSSINPIEPIEIFSNVENGLGVFGAIAETVISIDQ